MKTSKQKLAEAMEFHKEILRFFAKNYPTYIDELEKYAKNHGYYKGWDTMIQELQND